MKIGRRFRLYNDGFVMSNLTKSLLNTMDARFKL